LTINLDYRCPFCIIDKGRIINENKYAYVIRDVKPVVPLHSLVILKRHVVSYFDLSELELLSCHKLIITESEAVIEKDPSISGFNVGVNIEKSAGQSVFHCHIHLIPRRYGGSEKGVCGIPL